MAVFHDDCGLLLNKAIAPFVSYATSHSRQIFEPMFSIFSLIGSSAGIGLLIRTSQKVAKMKFRLPISDGLQASFSPTVLQIRFSGQRPGVRHSEAACYLCTIINRCLWPAVDQVEQESIKANLC